MVLVVFSAVGFYLGNIKSQGHSSSETIVDCSPWLKSCEFMIAGNVVSLTFSDQPKPLMPFEVLVSTQLELSGMSMNMDSMDMGSNQYSWRPMPGGWKSSVVLPVCVTGRTDWLMTINTTKGNAIIRFHTQSY